MKGGRFYSQQYVATVESNNGPNLRFSNLEVECTARVGAPVPRGGATHSSCLRCSSVV